MEPLKTEVKRDEKGRIVRGSGAINPAGRPPGPTLKEFARRYLMTLSDEEKLAYLKTLPPDIVWRMAEGNPHQTQDMTSKGQRMGIPILGIEKNAVLENDSSPEDSSAP